MKDPDYIRLPRTTYQRLLKHLQAHAATDSWAAQLLKELEQKAKPAYVLPSGSYLLSGEDDAEYRVN